jgi:hypothetical protein
MGLFSFLSACGLKEKKITDGKNFFKSTDKIKQKLDYLDKNVFYGLTNLNNGFDAPGIKYFSEKDFEVVLDRVRLLGLGVTGIEPWKDGEYYGVETYEAFTTDSTDSTWYLGSFKRFKETGDTIQYAATYHVPDKLLRE